MSKRNPFYQYGKKLKALGELMMDEKTPLPKLVNAASAVGLSLQFALFSKEEKLSSTQAEPSHGDDQ